MIVRQWGEKFFNTLRLHERTIALQNTVIYTTGLVKCMVQWSSQSSAAMGKIDRGGAPRSWQKLGSRLEETISIGKWNQVEGNLGKSQPSPIFRQRTRKIKMFPIFPSFSLRIGSSKNRSLNPAISFAFIVNKSAYWTEKPMLIKRPGIGQSI